MRLLVPAPARAIGGTRHRWGPGSLQARPSMTPMTTPDVHEIDADSWLNTPHPINLDSLRGQVVLLHAFQMLCPGCVMQGTPQAQRRPSRLCRPGPAGDRAAQCLRAPRRHEPRCAGSLCARVPADVPDSHRPTRRPGSAHPKDDAGLRPAWYAEFRLVGSHRSVRLNHFRQISDLELGAQIGGLFAEPGTRVAR